MEPQQASKLLLALCGLVTRGCMAMQEVIDRDTAVKLAEAAGQAVWGSAYHTINHPGGIQASHLSLLSQMALHTIE